MRRSFGEMVTKNEWMWANAPDRVTKKKPKTKLLLPIILVFLDELLHANDEQLSNNISY